MGQYEDNRQRYIQALGKGRKSNWIILGLILFFAFFIVAYSAWNAVSMERTSREDTVNYVEAIKEQIANTVNTDINDRKTVLNNNADSIEMFLQDNVDDTSTDEYIENFLTSKLNTEAFEFLVYLRDGQDYLSVGELPEEIQADIEDDSASMTSLEAAEVALEKSSCIAYEEAGCILFAVPVYKDGEAVGVLCGARNYEDMVSLIAPVQYKGESNSCVITRSGELLLTQNADGFSKLTEFLQGGSSKKSQELREKLTSDFADGVSGTVRISYSDGDSDYLTYAPLDGENWMLLILMPTDLFASLYSAYMVRALICAVGAAAVFLILVGCLVFGYRSNRKKLEELAFTDEVTQGINNTEFQRRFTRLRRRTEPSLYAIVMLDIHNFQLVNDSAGFHTGDKILRYIYLVILSCLDEKEYEFACRSEMDHYFICMKENTREGVQERIDTILENINTPEFRRKYEFRIEFTQSACIVDDYETEISVLQERARVARRSHDYSTLNKCVFYTENMERKANQDQRLDQMAEESIANHDFKVFFQPKVSMADKKVCGAEALVRWQHPTKGLISPGEFIPVLEQSGRIQQLDRYVFEEVCRWLSEREKSGKSMFPVSVNMSRTHFWKDQFLMEYVAIADKYQIDRQYIEFELTETVFMDDEKLEKVKEGIQKMHEYGFRCAVDDFGVGYSSLSLVNEMDVDILKFDRSFFLNLKDKKSQKIVHCLMNMAHELELDMVVEGIETQDQIDFLSSERCDVIQGYFYSRPLCEEDFNAWVDNFDSAA